MSISTTPYTFESVGIPAEAIVQSKHWYDRKGNLYLIKEMKPQHARASFKKLSGAYGIGGANSPLGKALWARATQK